ncbi:hypothetical protein RCL_jg22157.t1 [Rhizophagus clarus]|uniref:Uncharacterized protein n=1 Tax=Rhizophagus clarus TaxID=94130 RepID=A0A8H3QPF4_9GLOM|nr:hypothetical protein RCL_jg22157.t1 [Rhizophagus clarus]
MAALLDPQYKNLNFMSDESVKRNIHTTLRTKYDQLKWEISQQSIPSSPATITSMGSIAESQTPSRSLHEHKARHGQKTKELFQRTEAGTSSAAADEIISYFLMPIARENKNPLD